MKLATQLDPLQLSVTVTIEVLLMEMAVLTASTARELLVTMASPLLTVEHAMAMVGQF